MPLRGAVAAAMLCGGDMPSTVQVTGAKGPVAADRQGTARVLDCHSSVGQATDDDRNAHLMPDNPAGGGHQCHFCAAGGCGVTPLALALPVQPVVVLVRDLVFPALSARVADVSFGAQERPPRQA